MSVSASLIRDLVCLLGAAATRLSVTETATGEFVRQKAANSKK